MQYDFDTPIDRTHTWSIKHDFKKENGKADDILPLWVADMDFRSPDSVVEALKKAVDHGIFGYSRADESYFDAVAAWYQKRHHLTLQPEWMTCTPGIVFALSIAVRAFTQEGDAVLIQPPVYHPFSRAILRNKRTLVENPLVLKDGHYEMDLEELEQKVLDEHVKLMILCNPHNPVGRVWTREELTALADICLRHHVYVISDEIHGDFVWQGHEQTPYASISEEACLHSMMCTAPSKTFNLAGMATSNLFIPDPEMRRKFRSELLDVGQENMNRLGLFACRAAMKAAVYYDLQDMSKTGTKVSVNRGRLQLLGLAIHVAGDTYAHKAMVDVTDGGKELDTIYAKHLNNIKPYLVKPAQGMTPIINKAKSSEGLTTAHLGQNYFKNDKVSKKRANDYYTDSITYMAKRYSVATQVATGKLLNYYNNKANFSIFVFCPYELKKKGNQTYASIYNYKLLKLTQNVQDAGYRYADYSTGKNNTYNTSDWSRLSHN